MILKNPSSKTWLKIAVLAMTAICCWPLLAFAQQGGAANYFYDANGRLTSVLSPSGEAAIYNYDAAGNFTSITRFAANQLSILNFTPGTGSAATPVTIYGTGFSATPSANTVKFNGVTATVSAATNIRLDVQVPSGATTGPISVANTNGTINSSGNFFVTPGGVEFTKRTYFGEATPFTFNKTVNSAPLLTVGIMTFDAVAGQRVSLFIDDLIFLPGIQFAFSPYAQISILSPSGSSLVITPPNTTTFPIQDYAQYAAIFGYMDPLTLPETGTYSIVIDPNNNISTLPNQNGTYAMSGTVHLYDVSPDVTGTIAASGQPLPVNFGAPGQNAVLNFSGLNGQRICLRGSQDIATQIETNVKLYAPGAYPNGTPLISQSLFSSFFVDTMTLASNGVYTITIDPQLNKVRTTTLTLYDVPPDVTGTLTIGPSPATVNIPAVGQTALLTFNVASSQSLTVGIPGAFTQGNFIGGDHYVTVSLLRSDNTVVTSTTSFLQAFELSPQMLNSGTYKVKIDPQGTNTGSVNITIK